MNEFFRKTRAGIVKLINKKHFLDFLIAIISIPVMITLLINNVLNLQEKNKNEVETTTTTAQQIIIRDNQNTIPSPTEKEEEKITPTPSENCKKEIGPISISSPKEGEEVVDNPVCITIKHDHETYCTVVWSYRINGGSWSEYSSNSVCLYNVPKGEIKFDLRVQSTVSDDQETLSRTFIYNGEVLATESAEIN